MDDKPTKNIVMQAQAELTKNYENFTQNLPQLIKAREKERKLAHSSKKLATEPQDYEQEVNIFEAQNSPTQFSTVIYEQEENLF